MKGKEHAIPGTRSRPAVVPPAVDPLSTHVTLGPEPTRPKSVPAPVNLGPEPTRPKSVPAPVNLGPEPTSPTQKKVWPESKVEMPTRQRGTPAKQPGMKVLTPEMAEKEMKPQSQTTPKPVKLPPMPKTKGPGFFSKLKLLLTKLPNVKSKGKAGAIIGGLAAVGTALYALWDALQSEWGKYIDMAKEEADKAGHTTAQTIIQQIDRTGSEIDALLGGDKKGGVSIDEANKLNYLRSLVDALVEISGEVSERMVEAAQGISGLVDQFETQAEQYMSHSLKGISKGTPQQRVSSLQEFFKQFDSSIEITGQPDDRLRKHMEAFVRQMKQRFGGQFAKLTRNTLTAENLLNRANRQTMEDLLQVWRSPGDFTTKQEENKGYGPIVT
jgi:hypothetical protein